MIRSCALAASVSALSLSTAAFAQPVATPDAASDAASEIVVTGTRVAGRTKLDTASPVDVLSGDTLRGQGTGELAQALSKVAPSIDFPRASALDATDSIRPATLRGLSPDQTLVLINGIRGHTSALLNTNGSVGRGSAAFDLNTIPTVALDRVEVLRDGAAAQYGSDAIAGVVNLRLRQAREGGGASVNYGLYVTDLDPARSSRSVHDGQTVEASAWQGFAIGEDGFLTVSADYLNRGRTSRGDINTSVTPNRVFSRFGDPEVEQYNLFANAAAPLGGSGWQLYGFGGFQHRDSLSGTLPRTPSDYRNVAQLYPGGFIPLINIRSDDINAALGVRGDLGDWHIDINGSYGRNEISFRTQNSVNSTYGAASQTSFYSGRLVYDQWTGGVDVTRKLELGGDNSLNVAFGVQGRREGFKEGAGEPTSYNSGPITISPVDGTSRLPGGAQGFPGFRDTDVTKVSRSNIGAYVDLEAQLSHLTLGAAGRYEHYSDFDSNGTGKLSARYDFSPHFALRATGSLGFRAPSLQQSFYSFAQSNSINNVIYNIATVSSSGPIGSALGGKALSPEKSTNVSAGAVVRFGGFDLTVDAYRIHIRDQIVLSENLLANSSTVVANALAGTGFEGARFFLNGVSSTAKGIDVVGHYKVRTENLGDFDLTASGNYNEVRVTKVPGTFGGLALFTQQRITQLERGTPRWKGSFTSDWTRGILGGTVRATYYGSAIQPATSVVNYAYTGAHTLIDLEVRAKFNNAVTFAAGANNLFDVYPDRVSSTNGSNYNNGSTAYPYFSPFGFNGRQVYGRVSLSW